MSAKKCFFCRGEKLLKFDGSPKGGLLIQRVITNKKRRKKGFVSYKDSGGGHVPYKVEIIFDALPKKPSVFSDNLRVCRQQTKTIKYGKNYSVCLFE